MADVKIVDIDGSQWNMKDQVARDKITAIEESLIAQRLENIKISLKQGYTASQAEIINHYKVGKIHFMFILLRNISGTNIGSSITADIGKINIIPVKETSFILNDYTNNKILRCYLANDGTIAIGESNGVTQGNNSCLGELIFAED